MTNDLVKYVEPHPKSGVYRVRVPVPHRLRPILDATAFTKSLGTRDRRCAERQSYGVIADFRRRIEAAEQAHDAIERDGVHSAVLVSPTDAAGAIQAWAAAAREKLADEMWRRGASAAASSVAPELGQGGPAAFLRDFRNALVAAYATPGPHAALAEQDDRLHALLRRIMGDAGRGGSVLRYSVSVPIGGSPAG